MINQLNISAALEVFEATTTAPVAAAPPPKPAEAWPPLPPNVTAVSSFTDPSLLDNSAQLSDLENEIIAQTLLGHALSPCGTPDGSVLGKRVNRDVILPPLFLPRDDVGVEDKFVAELRRQSTPNIFQHFNSLPESLDGGGGGSNTSRINNGSVVNLQPKIVIDSLELNAKNLVPATTTTMVPDSQLLAAGPDPSIGRSVHKPRKVRHQQQKRQNFNQRSNVVAPSFYDQQLPLSTVGHESCIFQRLERGNPPHLVRTTTMAEDEPRQSDNESLVSSSGGEENLYRVRRVSISNPATKTAASGSSAHNTSSESNPSGVYHISGNAVAEEMSAVQPAKAAPPAKAKKSKKSAAGSKATAAVPANGKLARKKSNNKSMGLEAVDELPRPLSSTRITEVKATHFHSQASPAIVNLNNLLKEPSLDA